MPTFFAASASVSPPALASVNALTTSVTLFGELLLNVLAQRRFHVVECLVHAGRDLRDVDQHPTENELDRLRHAVLLNRERGRSALGAEIWPRSACLD
jgi:hypothetical protein